MPLNKGHAPMRLRTPFLEAIQTQDEQALFNILNENPDYAWGRFTTWLTHEERTWLHWAWKDWQDSRMP